MCVDLLTYRNAWQPLFTLGFYTLTNVVQLLAALPADQTNSSLVSYRRDVTFIP